jgi:peptide/nickel transport system permease protein
VSTTSSPRGSGPVAEQAPAATLEPLTASGAPGGALTTPTIGRARSEFVHFALRNTKFVIGLGVVLLFLVLALVGPLLTDHTPLEFSGPTDQPPSSEYWLGTTSAGQDVYSQFVYGLRAAFLVGTLGGGIAALLGMAVGFTAGYRGGWIDDVLNMLTNVVLVIPTLAILIIVAAYLTVQSYATEAILIGLTSWPWAARAIRAQTFSLKTREFVDVARLSGRSTRQIIVSEIASNMSSYLFMMFILLFGGAILIGASLDFLGLGPSASISLGLMMNNAFLASALLLGSWWWFIPPGIGIIAIVGGLYVMNVGLDEIFNPRLREL